MQKNISLRLSPQESSDKKKIIKAISVATGRPLSAISGFNILKRSIDARRGKVHIQLQLHIFIDEPFVPTPGDNFKFRDVSNAHSSVIIIGGGPAGIFAALQLLELGIKPVILERGKEVRARRRDLALLSREGILNEESNYCFGEGGAGTYSDGKLYTRSSKRGDVNRILRLFVHFGAEENILYDAHPHIGTNKLPNIITSMRKRIIDGGGEFHFQKKVIGFEITKNILKGVHTTDGDYFKANAFILATGHSARDIFHLL
ncbi:MAG: NAD(P)/FAD-dependent oxidoreductase, partial [Ginsengibacter sp.]